MEPIAVLPVFFKLGGKRALLAGGTEPAVWKAELLSAAGARVEVVASDPCAGLVDLADKPPGGAVTLIRRDWTDHDLAGAAIAIGAIEDMDEAGRFQAAARRAGVPVNVIDKPEFCDFQFGTIVSRSPLVIGISTDGAAPVFGQAIRTRIEAVLPQGVTAWAQAAKDWRPEIQALGLGFQARRRFWEAFTRRALAAFEAKPSGMDLLAFKAEAIGERDAPAACVVTLVGAGSGDPDGVTLAAVGALQAADVVLYAPDIPATIVGYARREATKLTVDEPQALDVIASLLEPGRRLAWLGKGDPSMCLRWKRREEALSTLRAITAIVPGLGRCPDCTPACPAWTRTSG